MRCLHNAARTFRQACVQAPNTARPPGPLTDPSLPPLSCCLLGSVVKPLPDYPAGVWFDPARVHLQFLNSRNVFDWLDPGSIPARVRRKNFRLPASRNPGSNPRHDRVRFLMSLACRLRSERPGFDSGFGSTAFRGIGRCRLRATETQRATPRNYADGRDRRRREAAATALRMVSKMPRQTMTNT